MSVSRKIVVCIQKLCMKCKSTHFVIPADCPYAILHSLETGGTQVRDRRTGKTHELLGIAADMSKNGYLVYYLVPTHREAMRLLHQHGNVAKFFSIHDVGIKIRGMAPGYVLADDVTDREMGEIRDVLVSAGHTIVLHYWTPR